MAAEQVRVAVAVTILVRLPTAITKGRSVATVDPWTAFAADVDEVAPGRLGFPRPSARTRIRSFPHGCFHMDLRDQLAAAALPGLLMAGALSGSDNEARHDLAREAYMIADAMLKVREETKLRS